MTDYTWPDDLTPFGSSFKLQPHTGGSESPFSRTSKIYGLSAPRWTCSLSFNAARGLSWGEGKHVIGARLDGIIARLRGRENRIAIWDFDFAEPRGGLAMATGNIAAVRGDASITFTGIAPGAPVYVGDYFGGDGRPHMIGAEDLGDIATTADGAGHATVVFDPPLVADIATDAVTLGKVTAMFRLASDDLGDNFNETGKLASYPLQFVEDLSG